MKYKLGILGLGKMGSSILSGIINSELYYKNDILLFDVNEEIKKSLEDLGLKADMEFIIKHTGKVWGTYWG